MVKMLGAFVRRFARGRARERHRTDARDGRWIEPEDGDVALGVRGEDARRHFPFARELHLRRRRCADAALIRDDEPSASTRNPDACVFAVQMPTTLFRHCCRRNPVSDSGAAPGAASDGPRSVTSALAAVRSRTVSRPAAMSTICIHWYRRPRNASGLSDSTV